MFEAPKLTNAKESVFTTATSAAKHSRSQPCNSATASSATPLPTLTGLVHFRCFD